MEGLSKAISSKDWSRAHSLAHSLSVPSSFVHKNLIVSQTSVGEPLAIDSLRVLLVDDPEWTAKSIVYYLKNSASSSSSQVHTHQDTGHLVDILSESTNRWLEKTVCDDGLLLSTLLANQIQSNEDDPTLIRARKLIEESQEIAEVCTARWVAQERSSQWKLYNEIYPDAGSKTSIKPHLQPTTPSGENGDDQSEIDCSGWDELEVDLNTHLETSPGYGPPPNFLTFCQADIHLMAHDFGSKLQLAQLRCLVSHQEFDLDPIQIFDSIPLHANPSNLDYGEDLIALLPRPQPGQHLTKSTVDVLQALFHKPKPKIHIHNDQQLTDWYLRRVDAIDTFTGCIDAAIEIVQHGAASGVLDLELIAEDLSLLGKLVYEAPHSSDYRDWTLKEWSFKTTDEIVGAYLSGSTATSLKKDLHRLVFPYLGVIESRRARLSLPEAESTIQDGIRNWALKQTTNLPLLLALVQGSSPTLKHYERMIKSDKELASVVIACLYTSPILDEWDCMGKMFECMPAFPDAEPPPPEFDPIVFLTKVLDDSKFAQGPRAQDVHEALCGINTGCFSVILDRLDDHLTTAEVLARWNVPARLADLVVKYHGHKAEQEKLATRLARQEGGLDMESEEEWEVLLEAMIELSKPGRSLDMLERNEVTRLFFSGLLTSGKFKLAKAMFSPSAGERPLDTEIQEELVIAASREFYDNAEHGNLEVEEMRMALECLSVAPQTVQIRRERDFIEATSQLSDFKLESQPGVLMSPIEIRLRANKLDLIAQLLQTNETAYRNDDLILDLVNKLAYRADSVAQIRALAMVVDRGLEVSDVRKSTDTCERMLVVLEEIKKLSRKIEPWARVEEASEIVWKTCEKLGTRQGLDNQISSQGKQAKFLAHAAIICPPAEISGLVSKWRKSESGFGTLWEDPARDHQIGSMAMSMRGSWSLADLDMPRTGSPIMSSAVNLSGDIATRTIGKAVSLFPFKSRNFTPTGLSKSKNTASDTHGPTGRSSEDRSSIGFDEKGTGPIGVSEPLSSLIRDDLGVGEAADRLTTALSNKFTSGVGWLIGANEADL